MMKNIAGVIGGDKAQNEEALKQALQNLLLIQQRILVLRYEEKLSMKQITIKTNCSATTVYKKLNSALYKLRKELNPDYYRKAFAILNDQCITDAF